uniref:O-antigen polysaccharide polymerase Wzy n=1 Tax=Geobacillus sp. (strain WCH70) TaxID=471223 RepID=C5D952_GEOSW
MRLSIKFVIHILIVIPLILLSYAIYESWFITSSSFVSLLFLALCIWLLITSKIERTSYFNPYTLFLVAAILFNGGQVLLYALGLNDFILGGKFQQETINQTIFLVMVGLSFFHLGGLLSEHHYNKTDKIVNQKEKEKFSDFELRVMGWLLLSISIIPTFILLKNSIEAVQQGGYFSLYQQEKVTSFKAASSVLSDFLIPGTLFLLGGSNLKNKKIPLIISFILIIIYTFIQFMLGSRSSAIMPLIAYLWLFDMKIKKIPRLPLLSAGAIILFIIFPFIGFIRNSTELNLLDAFREFFMVQNPAIAILNEMGGSMSTVAYTIELIPNIKNFEFGMSYIYGLSTILPNIFGGIHPAATKKLADWLVSTIDPSFASIGGGYGYSFIAEAYANFGWLGSPLALLIIGYLYRSFILKAQISGETAKLVMVSSFLAYFFFFARGESISQFRPLIWYSIIPYLGLYLIKDICMMYNKKINRLVSTK